MSRGLKLTIVFILIGVLALWLLWAFMVVPQMIVGARGENNLQNYGVWGDSFGGFSALINAFGFMILLGTLKYQLDAINKQDSIIEEQRSEFVRQAREAHYQRFETTFFEMLKLLRECRDQFSFGDKRGIEAFSKLSQRIHNANGFGGEVVKYSDDYRDEIHRIVEPNISPYFRVIYRILDKVTNDNIIKYEDKVEYSKLLRGQLSSVELFAIGVNATLKISNDFSGLLAEYHMLKYMPETPVRAELEELLPRGVFSARND